LTAIMPGIEDDAQFRQSWRDWHWSGPGRKRVSASYLQLIGVVSIDTFHRLFRYLASASCRAFWGHQ
ncbi:hypothetical protein, partial [Klebsiella michiganensis]|uniref:hypothetical protein n=1 Tax=Klebsiella michiganensis TaxID=1134687 RepID=UPI00195388D3